MGKAVTSILKDALQLSDSERAQLIDELLTTLEVDRDDDVDAAWAQEVAKRASEIAEGTVVPVIWDEVKARARPVFRVIGK
ncbi:MAG: addiction module protein [Nitrospirae bacterium]|nr:addiction module protein [Nitrospirota bacterium]